MFLGLIGKTRGKKVKYKLSIKSSWKANKYFFLGPISSDLSSWRKNISRESSNAHHSMMSNIWRYNLRENNGKEQQTTLLCSTHLS